MKRDPRDKAHASSAIAVLTIARRDAFKALLTGKLKIGAEIVTTRFPGTVKFGLGVARE